MRLLRSWRRWLLPIAAAVAASVVVLPLVVTGIEQHQARAVWPLEPYVVEPERAAGPAVIYFSRSGNTALAARHIANRLGARLVEVSAPDYDLGIAGWVDALMDARGHAAQITPQTVELTGHDPIYLGAPIWLYSPAPPIWAFARSNRFDGKRVVLFNTLNSTFDPACIEQFRALVMERGARAFEHRSVRRGRMTRQLAPEAMLDVIDAEWSLEPPMHR